MALASSIRRWIGLGDEHDATARTPIAKFEPGHRSLGIIVDKDGAERRRLGRLLEYEGVTPVEVSDSDDLDRHLTDTAAEIVFFGPQLTRDDRQRAARALSEKSYKGALQPVLPADQHGGELEELSEAGEARLRAPLDAPISRSDVQRIVREEGLLRDADGAPIVELTSAMRNNWIEFWYQPKIDLRRTMLAGVEAVPRVRHPTHGHLPTKSFLNHATALELDLLARAAIRSSFADWFYLHRHGFNVRIAVDVPTDFILTRDTLTLISRLKTPHLDWPGLDLELDCEDLEANYDRLRVAINVLRKKGLDVIIDDFRLTPPAMLAFREMEVRHAKVNIQMLDGNASERDVGIAAEVLDRHGGTVTAIRIDTEDDLRRAIEVGCSVGQGRYFCAPLPIKELALALRARADRRRRVSAKAAR